MQLGGLLLLLALRPLQPAGRLVAHHLGDLAAHVELADAVGVVVLAVLVARVVAASARPPEAQPGGGVAASAISRQTRRDSVRMGDSLQGQGMGKPTAFCSAAWARGGRPRDLTRSTWKSGPDRASERQTTLSR